MLAVISIANLFVGTLIGISGIAGFLLPITFTGLLGMPLPDALALSFVSFLTSGILGAFSYYKAGNLDLRFSAKLCAGSLAGALAGVWLNLLVPVNAAKILLYIVVLLSGISILVKKDPPAGGGAKSASPLAKNTLFVVLMGFLTAAICSLTGAGGPILVVPLLAAIGIDLRVAVGVSLLDSVAIALPACAGYLAHAGAENIGLLIAVSILTHGVGVLVGARVAGKVNLKALKWMVAFLAIGASLYMLASMLLF